LADTIKLKLPAESTSGPGGEEGSILPLFLVSAICFIEEQGTVWAKVTKKIIARGQRQLAQILMRV
jgi:hypothetical protein